MRILHHRSCKRGGRQLQLQSDLGSPRPAVQACGNVGLREVHALGSVYHHHYGEGHGTKTRNTFLIYRKQERGFHSDYCFAPKARMPYLRSAQVGAYAGWRHLSDHLSHDGGVQLQAQGRAAAPPSRSHECLPHPIRAERIGRLATCTLTVPGRRDRITVDPGGIRILARLLTNVLSASERPPRWRATITP